MKFEIIEFTPEIYTKEKVIKKALQELLRKRGIDERDVINRHYCPCCAGFGPGQGVSFCNYCENKYCEEERDYFDLQLKKAVQNEPN